MYVLDLFFFFINKYVWYFYFEKKNWLIIVVEFNILLYLCIMWIIIILEFILVEWFYFIWCILKWKGLFNEKI